MSGRSVSAVVAGILFAVIVTTLVDLVLHVIGVYPSGGTPLTDSLSAMATAYRAVIGVSAAWLTARLAPNKPMRHAMIGGAIGAVVALIGAMVTWNSNLGPHWYGIALAVLALPQSWLGARLFELRSSRTMQVADAA